MYTRITSFFAFVIVRLRCVGTYRRKLRTNFPEWAIVLASYNILYLKYYTKYYNNLNCQPIYHVVLREWNHISYETLIIKIMLLLSVFEKALFSYFIIP